MEIGTGQVKFEPLISNEIVSIKGQTQNVNTKLQCISGMSVYSNMSIEELRLQDYVNDRKFPAKAWFMRPSDLTTSSIGETNFSNSSGTQNKSFTSESAPFLDNFSSQKQTTQPAQGSSFLPDFGKTDSTTSATSNVFDTPKKSIFSNLDPIPMSTTPATAEAISFGSTAKSTGTPRALFQNSSITTTTQAKSPLSSLTTSPALKSILPEIKSTQSSDSTSNTSSKFGFNPSSSNAGNVAVASFNFNKSPILSAQLDSLKNSFTELAMLNTLRRNVFDYWKDAVCTVTDTKYSSAKYMLEHFASALKLTKPQYTVQSTGVFDKEMYIVQIEFNNFSALSSLRDSLEKAEQEASITIFEKFYKWMNASESEFSKLTDKIKQLSVSNSTINASADDSSTLTNASIDNE